MKNLTRRTAWSQAGRSIAQQSIGLALACLLCLSSYGCSTWRAPAKLDDTPLRERAVTATHGNIQVSAAVLSMEDNLNIFAANINDAGVQSVWIEIVNNSSHTLWLLESGTDPDYFSPLEVAWSLHKPLSPGTNSKIDEHFDSLSMKNPVPPGETRTAILYTNPHHNTRVLNIDLLGQQTIFYFTLFPPIPGEHNEEKLNALTERLDESRNNDYQDEAAFRLALEQLPCCATDPRTAVTADPVNAIFIGKLDDIGAALARRGYRRDPRDMDKTQWIFERPPDVVTRNKAQGGAPANWIRLWVAPFRYQGQSVLLAQSGRPVGGRFRSTADEYPVLHPNIDEMRSLIVQDMLYSGSLAKLAYVDDLSPVSDEQFRDNPGNYTYHTDGLRAVLFITDRTVSLSDTLFLDWATPLE